MSQKTLLAEQDEFVGVRFGRMTVVRSYRGDNYKRRLICMCDCGATADVDAYMAKKGFVKSCGCYRREIGRKKQFKHGLNNTSEFNIWWAMRQRCECPNQKFYYRYGGRGIRVCERWREFANFYSDMGPRPSMDHTLERKDNDGNYEPDNCVWATRKQQARNRRSSRFITIGGVKKTLAEWSEISGVGAGTIAFRIKSGFDESILLAPAKCGTNRREACKSN
jgi:hypothetical protein